MKDWAIIILTGLCLSLFISLIGVHNGGIREGYKKAYINMHEGTIEQIVREKFPKLWIKYNVPDFRLNKKRKQLYKDRYDEEKASQ